MDRFDSFHPPQPPGPPHFADQEGPLDAELTELLFGDTEPNLRMLARRIQHVPWLARRVVLAANSAVYGLASRVDSVEWAVLVIGLDRLRQIANLRRQTATREAV